MLLADTQPPISVKFTLGVNSVSYKKFTLLSKQEEDVCYFFLDIFKNSINFQIHTN